MRRPLAGTPHCSLNLPCATAFCCIILQYLKPLGYSSVGLGKSINLLLLTKDFIFEFSVSHFQISQLLFKSLHSFFVHHIPCDSNVVWSNTIAEIPYNCLPKYQAKL